MSFEAGNPGGNSETQASKHSLDDVRENAGERKRTSANVVVMFCTYNEVGNLPKIFELLDKHVPQADVLVVDDSSPDGTAEIVRQRAEADSRFHLLKRPGKLGLGTATRDGMRWCIEQGYEYLVNMDADLSHEPSSIPAVLGGCESDSTVDVSVGSRYVPGGGFEGLAWHRRLISRMLNGYATRLLSLPIRDCSGSFRCYRLSTLRKVDLSLLTCKGYGFLEEILVALLKVDAKFTEVPIRFDTRFSGESKLGVSDAVGALKVIHKLAFRKR